MRHVSHEHQDQLPLACTWGDATRDASGGATRTAPWKAGRVRTSPTPCPPSRTGSTTSLPRLRACHTGTAVAAVSPAARWGTTLSMRRQSRGRSWGNAAAGLRMPRSESPRCASSATTRRTSSVMPWLGSEHALATTKPAVGTALPQQTQPGSPRSGRSSWMLPRQPATPTRLRMAAQCIAPGTET